LKNDHGKEFQGNGRFFCEICSEAFVHAKSLMKHYEEHGTKIGKYIQYVQVELNPDKQTNDI